MEKLQPVIKQMFWILFGLAAMLGLFGWWSVSADLDQRITEREKAVKTAIKEGQQNVNNVPNQKWTVGAQEINGKHERSYRKSASRLYKAQYSSRTFPAEVSDELSQVDFNGKIENKSVREQYGLVYADYFDGQLQVIRPFELGDGVVDVSSANITKEDDLRWRNKRPTSAEIWNAQEDIWLLRSIFDSIAAVNEGFDRIDKAPLRALLELTLRGGDREAPAATAGSVGSAIATGSIVSLGRSREETESRRPAAATAATASSSSAGWQAFEGSLSSDLLTEEFGAVAIGGAGGRGGGRKRRGREAEDDPWGENAEPDPAEKKDATDDGRYVDDKADLPYRTRAFHLKVRILQEEIPALLAELTNSKFPVEIVRVDAAFDGDAGAAPAAAGTRRRRGRDDDERGGGFGGGGIGGGGRGAGFGGGRGRTTLGMSNRRDSRARRGGGRQTPLTPKEQLKAEQGERLLAAGLADTALCTLRVAGLMTLYRTAEENSADEETEAEEAIEAMEDGDAPITQTDSDDNANGESFEAPPEQEAPPLNENSFEDAAKEEKSNENSQPTGVTDSVPVTDTPNQK